MSITFLALLIVTWAVVIFSLSLLFVFGGGQAVPITETATEIDNAFNDAIGNTDEMDYVVSGLNQDDLTDLVDGLNQDDFVSGVNQNDLANFIDDVDPGPPRGIPQVDGKASNLKRRRIALPPPREEDIFGDGMDDGEGMDENDDYEDYEEDFIVSERPDENFNIDEA